MRVFICLIPLLCGCSTPLVRCDAHLLPINPPAAAGSIRAACLHKAADAREHALITAPAIDEYFREAESWDADRAAQYRRSARTAWWVAGAGWVCAVATATGARACSCP